MGETVLDFAAGPPSARSIKAAGHVGVVRYLSDGRESWMTGKRPTREQLDAYDAEGLRFAFVWQYRKGGKLETSDVGRGWAGGVEDARAARDRLNELRCAGHPVFFAVDFDCTLDEWNGVVVEYFKGAKSILGRQRVGIYGHSRAVAWAKQDGVVASVGTRALGWVTTAWGSRDWEGDAVLVQNRFNKIGPDGVRVDINDVIDDEWGWRTPPTVSRPSGDAHMKNWATLEPAVVARLPRGHHYTIGRSKPISMVVVHHNAGVNSTSSVRDVWLTRPASAHFQVETSGRIGGIVPVTDTAWHAANADINARSIGIEVSNSGGKQQGWPISDQAVESAARLIASVCRRYNLGEPRAGKNVRWHREFTSTSCPLHLAPGGRYNAVLMERARYWFNHPNGKENGSFMALTDEEQRRLLAHVDMLATQALGPEGGPNGGRGWEQLGQNAQGQWLTVVDAIAALRHDVNDLRAEIEGARK